VFTVSFIATFSNTQVVNVGSGGPIRFSSVVTNVGNGYSSATGMFTAPFPGLYSFFFAGQSDNSHIAGFEVQFVLVPR
jgi:hypothetical protein